MAEASIEVGSASRAELWMGVSEFLAREARMLDDNDLWTWLDLLDDDFEVVVPIRTLRERDADEFAGGGYRMRDTKGSLKKRVERLDTGHAWAEDPPSRTVRLVGNVTIKERVGDELHVMSALHLYREHGFEVRHDLLAGWRDDVIRGEGDEMRLLSRRVLLAHTVLDTPNLGLFL